MKSEKISSKEWFNAIDQIYQGKGITSEYLIDSLKSALKIAYNSLHSWNAELADSLMNAAGWSKINGEWIKTIESAGLE